MSIVLAAVVCTAVSEFTDAYVWDIREGVARDLVTLLALTAVGLYVRQFVVHEEAERIHLKALSDENAARVQADEQLTLLIGSSALAILTMNDEGIVLQANDAADRMFANAAATTSPVGHPISSLLPSLDRVIARSAQGHSMRTMMQSQGLRLSGEPFLAEVWFSSYSTSLGGRIAAMVMDVSEDVRTREESVTERLLNNSRLAVGAMTHEMRNVVGAIQLVMQSIYSGTPPEGDDANLLAMRELLSSLETMASVQLSQVRRTAAHISLSGFLSELQVVAQAILSEDAIAFEWDAAGEQPFVWADSEGLMQVFLNLLRNSRAALTQTENAKVGIRCIDAGSHVEITVTDNGPGIREPQNLFRPFHKAKTMNGLGLYLSRAIMNSFRGDLRYMPTDRGTQFVVQLEVMKP